MTRAIASFVNETEPYQTGYGESNGDKLILPDAYRIYFTSLGPCQEVLLKLVLVR